jgi:hypothetical protein
MAQLTLSDAELLKKALWTTSVMLGATALWLGGMSGAVVLATGSSSSSSGASESKVEAKGDKAGPGLAGSPKGATVPPGAVKAMHRPAPLIQKPEVPHAGEAPP